MPLSERHQVLVKVEAVEGTPETPTASDLVEILNDPAPTMDGRSDSIERRIATGSMTRVSPLAGNRPGSIQLRAELAGPVDGNPATPLPWGPLAAACGFRHITSNCKKHAMAASWASGTVLEHGSVFTADVTGAQGIVIGDWHQGEEFFVYEVFSNPPIGASDTEISVAGGPTVTLASPGTLANCQALVPDDIPSSSITVDAITSGPISFGDELLGGTSGARGYCVNPQPLNTAGKLFYVLYRAGTVQPVFENGETISVVNGSATTTALASPTQRSIPSLTIWNPLDGTIERLKGARGNLSLAVQGGDRGILTFDMQGANLGPIDQANFTWPGPRAALPPTSKTGLFEIDGTFYPLYGTITYAAQNTLRTRTSPTEPSGTGILSAEITGRSHQTTFDTEAVREVIYPWLGNHYTKTPFRLSHRIGAAAGGVGNTFLIRQRRLVADEKSHGDDSGARMTSLTCGAVAGADQVGRDETIIIAH